MRSKKNKYHTDEKYREKIIERSKKYYHQNKKLKIFKPDIIVKKCSSPKIIKDHSGKKVFAFQIGYVASRLARTVETMRKWIKEKVIPETQYRLSGKRLYTEEMISVMEDALRKMHYPAKVDKDKFKKLVQEKWPNNMED